MTDVPQTPVEKKIGDAILARSRACILYANNAAFALTHRLEGKTRAETLAILIGKEGRCNEHFSKIMDFVYDVVLDDLENEVKNKERYLQVRQYAVDVVSAGFKVVEASQ